MRTTVELEAEVRRVLATLHDPCSIRNRTPLTLTEMGLIEEVEVSSEGAAKVTLLLTDPSCVFFFDMGRNVQDEVLAIDGITSVEVASIGDRWWEEEERMTPEARERLAGMRSARNARMTAPARGDRPVLAVTPGHR